MRVAALAVLAAIIVASGLWLARDRSTPQSQATEQQTSAASTAGTEAAPRTDEDADQPAEADDQATEAPDDGAVALPEGFTQVSFLTDAPQQAFNAPEQVLEPALDYVAVIRTNRGDITVDLYEAQTPETVNNFVFLALHRYYEGVPFHRVIDGFMAQTGDPTGTGSGGPGYQFGDEIVDGLAFDSEGILAMANAGPGTNGSQFFITFGPAAWLTGAHTIFGHVTQGAEVLPLITRVDPAQPSAAVLYTASLAELAEQGIELPPVNGANNVAEAIEDLLGALPSPGQSFTVAGYRGVAGQLGNQPAFGFYFAPDQIYSVVIAARPT